MSDLKITIGGPLEADAAERFVGAWRRGERGETFHERHLAFESPGALARISKFKRAGKVKPKSKLPPGTPK